MSILDTINEAEEQANHLRGDARAKARDILRQAEEQAEAAHEKAINTCREERNGLAKDATLAAQNAMEAVLKKEEIANLEFAKQSQDNLPKAVSFVLERIMDL